jgi:GT2 family glycosyltransferase
MPKKVAIIISPNYKDYAGKYLAECYESLKGQDYGGETRIYLADNESSPESVLFLSKTAPEAELVLNKTNDGFAKGNNDCMRLAINEGFDYIFLINMDTVVEPDCVREMVDVMERQTLSNFPLEKGENPNGRQTTPNPSLERRGVIGAVQARLMLYDDKNKINSLGNAAHFLGFGYCVGYNEEWSGRNPASSSLEKGKDLNGRQTTPNPSLERRGIEGGDIFYPSGAAVMYRAEALKEVGLFDEEFWMYNEDEDHGWRFWLAGWRVVLAPEAVVYHKYEFAKSIKQYYWMDRNRILCILKNYSLLILLLILPAFIIMEFGLVLFSLKGGWFKEKIKVWFYFLNPLKWVYIIQARRDSQAVRKIKDKDIVDLISGRIWYQEIDDWKLRFINPVFEFYWRIVKRIIS